MPSKYTEELADEIVERISTGVTLREICREEGKPHWTTVYDWIRDNQDFALRIARARELGHDAIAEECIEIADDSGAELTIDPKTGAIKIDGEAIQRAKLRIETRLKLLSKWSSGKYADKVAVNHGGQKDNPLIIATADEQILKDYIKHDEADESGSV